MPWELDTPGEKPWDRQDDETMHSYGAFAVYRDLGPARSLTRAANSFYAPDGAPGNWEASAAQVRVVERWSAANGWRKRAEAWDEALERLTRADQVAAQRAMRQRHAAAATLAVSKAIEKLRAVKTDELSLVDAARLLDIGTKVERLAREMPDSIVQHQGPGGGPIEHEDVTPSIDRSVAILAAAIEAGLDLTGIDPVGEAEPAPTGEAGDVPAEAGATDSM